MHNTQHHASSLKRLFQPKRYLSGIALFIFYHLSPARLVKKPLGGETASRGTRLPATLMPCPARRHSSTTVKDIFKNVHPSQAHVSGPWSQPSLTELTELRWT